ncbi:MAG: dephospho-CoA kinase [Dictyoglomus sp. NZ13-RE01]|nr:MAG: dephospho-CoA kinase [Dictyoglomus sp. NZ13-RE01]
MFVLGITGGIATGKTLVSNILRRLGIEVISADEIVHNLYQDPYYLKKIREAFGDEVFDGEKLNRKKLGELVFSSEENRKKINSIVHPAVLEIMRREIEGRKKEKGILALEIPLLFEVGISDWFDEIWVVYAPIEKQIERLIERDNLSYESAMSRIKAQLPIEEKIKRAHFVIDNSGSIENTIKQVESRIEYINKICLTN